MSIRSFEQHRPQIAASAFVDETAQVIGAVTIDEDASLWPFCVARGDVNTIEIGARSNLQDATIVHVTHDGPYSPGGIATVIGADVTVGHRCLLHACTIGDHCLIGMGAIIMDGAVLEDEVLLAAGSLVSPGKTLRSGWLYRGRPAKPVRELDTREREGLRYSAAHYVRLKNRYAATSV